MPKRISDEDIYDVAMRLFIERGYTGATTRQIADEANVNEVTLFRKFGSKAELVTEAVAHEVGRISLEAIRYTGDVVADLSRIVYFYQQGVQKYGEFFPVLLAEIPRYPELRPVLRAPLRIITAIAQVLRRYQEEGVLQEEPPLHAVCGLLGPVIVLTLIRGADPDLEMPALDLHAHVIGFVRGRQCEPSPEDS